MKELIYAKNLKAVIVDGEHIDLTEELLETIDEALSDVIWTENLKEYTLIVNGLLQTQPLTDKEFTKIVSPLFEKWQKAKEEQEEQFRIDSLSYTEKFNEGLITEEEYANAIRAERNVRISQVESSNDYKKAQRLALLGDTSAITELEKFEEQIQALREIPQTEGFPETFTGFETFKL